VLADLAVAIADGGDALTHLSVLRDQGKLFGQVASEPTAWRAVERVDEAHLGRLRAVRAAARERAWAAGAGPDVTAGLVIDLDATITIAHSEKQNAAATWKKTYGLFHPLLAYLDRPDVSGGEALAGLLRPGNAGSKHRRRSCHGTGHGAGRPAGTRPAAARPAGLAGDPGPHRRCGRHPRLRRRRGRARLLVLPRVRHRRAGARGDPLRSRPLLDGGL
jgi:hypothetical protein